MRAISCVLGACVALGVCALATLACEPDKMTLYRVVLHTYWTRQLFPKHYPDWRPPAQWSKLIGRSHDASYWLWRVGRRASPGVKELAETGVAEALDAAEAQGDAGVLDAFLAPPIAQGAGRTETQFFVDGNHTRVSLMARMVPSPDWFIGIDSFDLCVDGNWLDSITIEADPMDAGTDNGFTFTAPNWATEPQGVVYRVTSRYPPHPAGSFYYPYLKRLPPIATFQFIKWKEYELSEIFHHDEDDKRYDLMRLDQKNTIGQNNLDNDIQIQMEAERREQEMRLQQQHRTLTNSTASTLVAARPSMAVPAMVARGDKDAILNSIVETYHNQEPQKLKTKIKKPLRKFKGGGRDCKVSEWGAWGACSASCGVGEMTRQRTVERHARRSGKPCPPLMQTKWCGAGQDCPTDSYFTW
ncbi:spondin-2 [Nilaparvata lugens]|uniref:spondin-2 n=1 Tax=Nilaparvata lugens TaxID=108931 RepID=UPI000B9929E4|nr:spondin-2 [Nilaparvata lugens]